MLTTAAAAAHAFPPSHIGSRRPRRATIIQRQPPVTGTAPTAASPRKHGSRAAHVRTPHPSHTQHTCGSRPHLSSRTTEAAAVDTRNSGGGRATPMRQPRNASAASAPVSTSAVAAPVTRHRQPWPRRPGWSHEQARRPLLDMSKTSAVAATYLTQQRPWPGASREYRKKGAGKQTHPPRFPGRTIKTIPLNMHPLSHTPSNCRRFKSTTCKKHDVIAPP